MKRYLLALVGLFALGSLRALASGMLIPKDESVPPLAIESQRVDINIKDGVAMSRIEQVFRNSVNRNLEAVYIFPLPENASISDFAMYINGKRASGELVEKDKARRTYEDIVRRMKDPGLLEHIGGNLFRVSVFPVPASGLQKIELEYTQALAFAGGLYKYLYPLKTGDRASRTLADFTVGVRLNSKIPIKSIYSPTHKVGITRKSDAEAVIGFEEDKSLLDRDFALYYAVSQKDFGLNLLTHAAKNDKGFFMMMIAPSLAAPDTVMRKDVTFVFDTSGSMTGGKIEQTRKALEYCVQKLHGGDRFNIVAFSTEVEAFKPDLVDVNDKTRDEALAFIRKAETRGGTAINDALAKALALSYKSERPALVLFLTDGKPTIGETDSAVILANAGKANKAKARIFVFGVGEDVNTHLLDKLAGQNGGLPQYVAPNEDIEVKVSSLMDKMSDPVLANVRVEIDKLKTAMVHPAALPDLFSGDQVTVFGRYDGSGDYAIRLLGEVNGKKREFVYEGSFPAANAENAFIPRLWATRRVGYLLDEIRLHGENAELKDEVIRLSREYGIMTPYTSFLVLESDQAYVQHGIARGQQQFKAGRSSDSQQKQAGQQGGGEKQGQSAAGQPQVSGSESREEKDGFLYARHAAKAANTPAPDKPGDALNRLQGAAERRPDATADKAAEKELGKRIVPVFTSAYGSESQPQPGSATPGPSARGSGEGVGGGAKSDLKLESGARAIDMSEAIQEYKAQDRERDELATVRHVGKKTFTLSAGRWTDIAYKKDMKTTTVKFGSEEYFKIIKDQPALKEFLALGQKVTVVLEDGTALVIE